MAAPHSPDAVLDFWFEEIAPKQWWAKDAAFDGLVASRFGEVLRAAARCELFGWRETAQGRLAEILVLDQFSRNVHRDTPGAFANDALALALAQEAVARGADREVGAVRRPFVLMPWMHSESRAIHAVALALFADEDNLEFERRHKAIVDRFGRFPHRNAILGRASTAEEIAFLATPGSAF